MMLINYIAVSGYRGFSREQHLNLAIPNGELGGGLTIITGTNNSGKSTVFEVIHAFRSSVDISFSEGKRNNETNRKVKLKMGVTNADESKEEFIISTIPEGGSAAIRTQKESFNIITLPAKRYFQPFFSSAHENNRGYGAERSGNGATSFNGVFAMLNKISARLMAINKDSQRREEFSQLLAEVTNEPLNWYIEQDHEGKNFIAINKGINTHNSDGLGNGLISLLFIVEVLFSSKPNDLIVIDEPELSLHASLQKKVCKLLAHYAKDRQIVIITHSPYFIHLSALKNGANLCRIYQINHASYIRELSQESKNKISSLIDNTFNPHILGINACEVFCLEENIILVEGQEDVVFYPKVLEQLGMVIDGEFYGWGVGGAGNIEKIAHVLRDLGFKKVVGVVDNDKKAELISLQEKFPEFRFFAIPADDVRFKKFEPARNEKQGLLDKSNKIKDIYVEDTKNLFNSIQSYFNDN